MKVRVPVYIDKPIIGTYHNLIGYRRVPLLDSYHQQVYEDREQITAQVTIDLGRVTK